MAADKVYYATGRRKTSAARVFLKPGKGNVTINGFKADEYLKRMQSKMVILQPFDVLAQMGKFDVTVTVVGGGENGQTGAIRLGIARALTAFDPEFRLDVACRDRCDRLRRKSGSGRDLRSWLQNDQLYPNRKRL